MYKGPERRTPEAGRRARDAHAVELWDAIEELGKLAAVQAGRNRELEDILRRSSSSELSGMRRAIRAQAAGDDGMADMPPQSDPRWTDSTDPRELERRIAALEALGSDRYELAVRVKALEDAPATAPATAPTAGSVLEALEGMRIRVERLERTDKERNTELANVVRMLEELTGDVRALEGART